MQPWLSSTRLAANLRATQLALLLVYVVIVIRHAWMMDDAFITLRTVDNIFHGYGPVWNPGERVQSYTHPLWMLLCCLAHAASGEFIYSIMALGLLVSTIALSILTLKLARSAWVAIALIVAATLSHAFVDWSTGGLENPLTHLLIALFAWAWLGQRPSARQFRDLCLIGGLSLLSRPDNAVLLGPAVLAAGWQAWRHGVSVRALCKAALIGGAPLFMWELFSLFYYGSLVPNTALAKLRAGIDAGETFEQGLFYVLATLDVDPLTLVVTLAGMAAPLIAGHRRLLPLSLGIGLHLLYAVSIGGDFMLGRFFTAPMFLAMVCLSQLRVHPVPLALASAVLVALGLAAHPNTLELNSKTSESPMVARTHRKVTDERTLLFEAFGLVQDKREDEPPGAFWWSRNRATHTVETNTVLGYRGLVNGPDVHWIDNTALSDPLLARLPASYKPDWMTGHLHRLIPEGYADTLEHGVNVIEDPSVAELYDKLDLVVHGELFSGERLAAIWWLNTGGPERLINEETWRFKNAIKFPARKLAWRVPDRTKLDSVDVFNFGTHGAYIKFGERLHVARLDLSVNGHKPFVLLFYDGAEVVARVEVPMRLGHKDDSLMSREVELPEPLTERGFTRMRVLPLAPSKTFAIGHLLFDDAIDTAAPLAERPTEFDPIGKPAKQAKQAKARNKPNKTGKPGAGKPKP
jgi:arabinofuranosyltransferase